MPDSPFRGLPASCLKGFLAVSLGIRRSILDLPRSPRVILKAAIRLFWMLAEAVAFLG